MAGPDVHDVMGGNTAPEPSLILKRWWEAPDQVTQRWCGVFKGGGAKGIAYVGALEALVEKKVWFRSVAGSSAGALTATLVAAGIESTQLRDTSGEMLSLVRRSFAGLVLGGAWTLYSLNPLTHWLEQLLRSQVSGFAQAGFGTTVADGQAVTFAALYAATGIELNIVVMDLATSQPVVLNHLSTPTCSVALAAAASSSIPVAFSSGRLMVLAHDGKFAVHRVVDGGAWANYPRFVYGDPSFRAFHGLAPMEPDIKVVGFVLERGPSLTFLQPWQIRPDLETEEVEDFGLFVRSKWPSRVLRRLDKTGWRLVVLVIWPLLSTVVTLNWLWQDRAQWQPLVAAYGAWFSVGRFAFVAGAALAAAMYLALAAIAFAFGRELIRVGVGTVAATTSVSTGVPYWLGASADDPVIRVPFPATVSTTSFRLKASVRAQAIDDARDAVVPQLVKVLTSEATTAPPPVPAVDQAVPTIDQIQVLSYGLVGRETVIVGLFYTAVVALIANGVIFDLVVDHVYPDWGSLATIGLFMLFPISGFWLYARGGHKRRVVRANELRRVAQQLAQGQLAGGSEPFTRRRLRRHAITYTVLAVLAVAVMIALVVGMGNEAGRGISAHGTVLNVRHEAGQEFDHTVRIDDGEYAGTTVHVFSPPHARAGQRVRVLIRPSDPIPVIWAANQQGMVIDIVIIGSFWIASFGCGAVWRWLDYAELGREGVDSQLDLVRP
jgi:Patatin-like phospholipase